MSTATRTAVGAIILAFVASAAAPSVQQSRPRRFDPKLFETGDLIRYKDLTRDDFRADSPPEGAGGHFDLGAATCVYLTTHPDMFLRAASRGLDARLGQVRVTVENLGFTAFMDRSCSWWNPRSMTLPADYILEHEQVHFALFEIAARQLNARARELAPEWELVRADQQMAIEEMRTLIDAELGAALDVVVERSNSLDDETSQTYRPNRLSWWSNLVEDELGQLAAAGIAEGSR